jgi:hypothetical protein
VRFAALVMRSQNVAPDATVTVNCNLDGHCFSPKLFSLC